MNIFEVLLIKPLANGLILFYRILGGNLGVAIIGFSLFLRFILNPLTKPYMKSMQRMKELTPQLEKIKSKFKGDKMKLAQAQAELYKQNKVNPSSGCLPYILQIVVLIAFFNVFTQTLTPDGNPAERFNKLLYEPLKFTQEQNINTRFLYLDVTKPDVFHISLIPFKLPGPILILAALIQFLSSKLMMPQVNQESKIAKKTKQSTDDLQVAMQKSMVYTFPLFTIIFGMSFPSGLAIYWLLFSLWQFLQQYQTNGWGALKPLIEKFGLIKENTK